MHDMTNAAPAAYDFWAHLKDAPQEFWAVLIAMAPYLLLGFLIAGLLSVLVSPKMVERHLGGKGLLPVIKAAVLGIPLPFCSCGVVPISASLRRHKASRGATTSFLISTPQTGVDSIAVTYSLLGPVFAIFRPIAALVTGIVGGAIVALVTHEHPEPLPEELCREACCVPGEKPRNKFLEVLRYGLVVLPRDIGKPLLVGLVVAALISALLPKDFFKPYLGQGIVPILVMMLLGIPVYVCSTASVPVAAALVLAGVSPGAAFAFLATGPATNPATITTVWKVMGPRTAIAYLATVAGGAIAGGLLLNYFLPNGQAVASMAGHEMLPYWLAAICAVALLAILGAAVLGHHISGGSDAHQHAGHTHEDDAPEQEHIDSGHEHAGRGHDRHNYAGDDRGDDRLLAESPGPGNGAEEPLEELSLKLSGMHCSHCADAIQRALAETAGVQSATVDLAGARARVSGRNLDAAKIRQAITSLGYTVVD
jgi:uncharacterized membrane protein YraQ (UPF0718 family)/copper chaperone CopZ